MLNSSFLFEVVWNTRASILIFSTPGPYSSLRVATMRVFLPAPEGPYTRRWGKSPLCACVKLLISGGSSKVQRRGRFLQELLDALKDLGGS
jgi:hypothetical protein